MKPRILVVEDNPLNRELLCEWLDAEGYEVVTAADLKTGFEAVEKEWLRQQPALRDIPVIAVTAHAMMTERERILQAGCNACVSKPVDFKLLREQLQRWLTNARMPHSNS